VGAPASDLLSVLDNKENSRPMAARSYRKESVEGQPGRVHISNSTMKYNEVFCYISAIFIDKIFLVDSFNCVSSVTGRSTSEQTIFLEFDSFGQKVRMASIVICKLNEVPGSGVPRQNSGSSKGVNYKNNSKGVSLNGSNSGSRGFSTVQFNRPNLLIHILPNKADRYIFYNTVKSRRSTRE